MVKVLFWFVLIFLVLGCICSGSTCNKPYIPVGQECCLDQNGNNICDKDESENWAKDIKRQITTTTLKNVGNNPQSSLVGPPYEDREGHSTEACVNLIKKGHNPTFMWDAVCSVSASKDYIQCLQRLDYYRSIYGTNLTDKFKDRGKDAITCTDVTTELGDCKNLKNPYNAKACQAVNILTLTDASKCGSLDDENMIKSCLIMVSFTTNNFDACIQVADDDVEMQDSCYYNFAISDKDSEYCKHISDSKTYSNCMAELSH
ncbi:MAG: hypothetical protein V1744_03970 [Candidatus Altiarchaeota archaeon]